MVSGKQIEDRAWGILLAAFSFVFTVALALGGVWLQNQYDTLVKTNDRLLEYQRYVDSRYVDKEMFETLIKRLDQLDNKIDTRLDLLDDRLRKGFNQNGPGLRGAN